MWSLYLILAASVLIFGAIGVVSWIYDAICREIMMKKWGWKLGVVCSYVFGPRVPR